MIQEEFYQVYSTNQSDFLEHYCIDNIGTNQSDFLEHHGILGQKWGIRRFQNKDGSLTPEGKKRYGRKEFAQYIGPKDKTYNLDKWGKSPDTNLLYITGLSGSGKSTLARNLQKESGADYIELDAYYENPYLTSKRSDSFDKYLRKTVPEYESDIVKNFEEYDAARFNMQSKKGQKYWRTMDKVRDAMIEYSKQHDRPVIAEGVQLLDTGLYPDTDQKRNAIYGKPVIIKETNPLLSELRAIKRDDVRPTLSYVGNRYKMAKNWTKGKLEVNKILRGD